MLSKHYDHHEVEKGKYDEWKKRGYFGTKDLTKTKFSMVIPPPNVTGKLHLGHAWNTTIQDIIARYKRAKGYDVLWVPGMDHAGIATQAKVEERLRKEGISRYDLGREKFLEKAYEWKKEYSETIHDQWKMMGLSLDYNRERFTLDEGLNKAVRHVFCELYKKGLIYRGEKIINWDPVLKTALSNIEVIHSDDQGKFYYFKYQIVGTSRFLEVATTRPETMFGDVCVVVNPRDERYKDLIGKKVINPANHEELPIIGDEYVDIEFGTGAMKCTPAHDPNDFEIAKRHHLPHPICMNEDATMNDLCGEKYVGLDRYECRDKLVAAIEKEGNLIKIENIVHPVGHSERSKCVVEPYLSKQWFVKMKPLAMQALEAQKSENRVDFIPERFEKIFTNWMNDCEDWCISRQLWWGHRIPAYYHKTTGEMIVCEEPPKDLENYIQDEDVLDTWFSSALWPFSTLGWPEKTEDLKRYYPLDVLVTAYDIIFFWVSRMIFQGLEFTDTHPFKKVLIHGLIRDEQGRKMSKSLGNGIDPIDVIEKYGVDALRYFLTTSTSPGLDTRYSDIKLQSASNYLNKIWNAARFILLNLEKEEKLDIDDSKLDVLDRFILSRLNKCVENVTLNMDKYDFANASTHLYNFVYDDFTSWYLELAKVKLNTADVESVRNTKAVLLKVLKDIVILIYPYVPFIAEEIYQQLPHHLESIMLETYPEVAKERYDEKSEMIVLDLIKMIKDVRSYKVECKLAPNAPIELEIITNQRPMVEILLPFLKRMTFASKINFVNEFKDGNPRVYQLATMVIKDNVDKEKLLATLNAEIERLENEVARGEKMLSNENFIAKAPKEKVALEQKKLADYKKQLQEYRDKKNNL